ncbi:hypothetical protein [Celeribacter baekdonensis]|uniref:hypothetical protein n=1 Tax=Celeribacter baekdonensis TaxID=875171 RepID=UPI003A91ED05
MTRSQWHISEADGALILSRRLPAQFDVAVKTVISGGAGLRKARIAHQVRQDMWRALQNLRGFSPVVRVATHGPDLEITAGGTIAGRFPKAATEARVSEVLENPELRARWARYATALKKEKTT